MLARIFLTCLFLLYTLISGCGKSNLLLLPGNVGINANNGNGNENEKKKPVEYGITIPQGQKNFNSLPSNAVSIIIEINNRLFVGTRGGLAISDDDGVSFSVKTTNDGLWGNDIRDILQVNDKILVGSINGIAISEDNGNTFRRVHYLYPVESLQEMLYNEKLGKVIIATNQRSYYSDDFGETYKTLLEQQSIGALVVNSTIYILDYKGIWISKDAGASFNLKPKPSTSEYSNKILNIGNVIIANYDNNGEVGLKTLDLEGNEISRLQKGVNFSVLKVYNDKLYACVEGRLLLSSDIALTFQELLPQSSNTFGIYIHGSNFYTTTNDSHIGYKVSTDSGATFKTIMTKGGISYNDISDVEIDDQGNMWVGTNGAGGMKSEDEGRTYSPFSMSTNSKQVGDVNYVNKKLYISAGSEIAISSDYGKNFQKKTKNDGLGNGWIQQLCFYQNYVFAATSTGLAISADQGENFTLKTKADGMADSVILSCAISNNGTIFLGTNKGLSVSKDNGQIYKNYFNDIQVTYVTAYKGRVFAHTVNGLLYSDDDGQNFQQVEGFSGRQIWPSSSAMHGDDMYIASRFYGIYKSVDGGKKFEKFLRPDMGNLSCDEVNSIKFFGDVLYAATDCGLFRKLVD